VLNQTVGAVSITTNWLLETSETPRKPPTARFRGLAALLDLQPAVSTGDAVACGPARRRSCLAPLTFVPRSQRLLLGCTRATLSSTSGVTEPSAPSSPTRQWLSGHLSGGTERGEALEQGWRCKQGETTQPSRGPTGDAVARGHRNRTE